MRRIASRSAVAFSTSPGSMPSACGPGRNRLIAVLDGGDASDERTVLATLDVDDICRTFAFRDGGFVHPAEIGASQIAVTELQLDSPVAEMFRRTGLRDSFARRNLAEQHGAVVERELNQVAGPEESETVAEDQADHPADHQQADAERAAGQPDRGIPTVQSLPPCHQTAL